jgi:hypothetical protein
MMNKLDQAHAFNELLPDFSLESNQEMDVIFQVNLTATAHVTHGG